MTTVTALIYYPIKSCRGCEVDEIEVQRMGLANDRRLMVVDSAGRFLTQRDAPQLALVTPTLSPENLILSAPGMDSLTLQLRTSGPTRPVDIWKSRDVPAIDQGEAAADWFSTLLGRSARLVRLAEGHRRLINEKYAIYPDDHTGFADGYPILLASEDSLADLNARLQTPVPMNRFRPNLVVRGCTPFAEDTWTRIRIGEVQLAIVKPCARCVVTTIDQQTLARGREPLETLATYRKQQNGVMFGQNVIPLNEGTLRRGMNVEILKGK